MCFSANEVLIFVDLLIGSRSVVSECFSTLLLKNNPVPKKYFQLVCVTAMLIASKYEEIYPPTVGDFAFVTDGAYTCRDIWRMERIVLKRLNYSLGRPGPVHFLQRACKVGQVSHCPDLYTIVQYERVSSAH